MTRVMRPRLRLETGTHQQEATNAWDFGHEVRSDRMR
jgi:hypothetical protein